jgi:8-oxo-dGTP pyrophosphatase MutT (NUDIX family)
VALNFFCGSEGTTGRLPLPVTQGQQSWQGAHNRTMDLPDAPAPEIPRDSASVILLREGDAGLEVFLVRRHGASEVLGGAYVFPGGKLDASDRQLNTSRLDADDTKLHGQLAEPELEASHAKGLFVAAIREAFEESGVLFAVGLTPVLLAQAHQHIQGQCSFNRMLEMLDLRLLTAAVQPWSRWITPLRPSVSSRRFDTRFFVATVPHDQTALHDSVETTDSLWLRPSHALQRYADHAMDLAPPQLMTLAHLASFDSLQSIRLHASRTAPPTVFPHAFDQDGVRIICYPGDPQHSLPVPVMPGPTRLMLRDRRFQPEGGLQAWFQ